MNIRNANLNDLETLCSMQQAMAKETENMILEDEKIRLGISKMLADPLLGSYFLIENQKHNPIACFMITFEWSDWRNATWIWIQSVYVNPDCRGRGIFKKIKSFLEANYQKTDSFCGLRLYVDKNNSGAIEVYKKSGMTNQHYDMFEFEY